MIFPALRSDGVFVAPFWRDAQWSSVAHVTRVSPTSGVQSTEVRGSNCGGYTLQVRGSLKFGAWAFGVYDFRVWNTGFVAWIWALGCRVYDLVFY